MIRRSFFGGADSAGAAEQGPKDGLISAGFVEKVLTGAAALIPVARGQPSGSRMVLMLRLGVLGGERPGGRVGIQELGVYLLGD